MRDYSISTKIKQGVLSQRMIKTGWIIPLVGLLVLGCDPPGDNRLWITNPTRDSLY